eukprot:CAMPEP_0171593002 /NCGR_PEP_ID=MMETSP0961-20121227/17205_1 /TAXON_ID=87120 /ORGANISM="Aurantiochytrium limacinum, Strain ATCCMYA-1381" /LENGTH=139 /DNA_ID=CAMNT_0012153449 /DNA_START=900 /DNA_END=1316 /DNA_ORIENTATION=+
MQASKHTAFQSILSNRRSPSDASQSAADATVAIAADLNGLRSSRAPLCKQSKTRNSCSLRTASSRSRGGSLARSHGVMAGASSHREKVVWASGWTQGWSEAGSERRGPRGSRDGPNPRRRAPVAARRTGSSTGQRSSTG